MKKLKIHYLSIAEKDITNIIDYINKDNPNAALKLIDKIDSRIKELRNFPEIGKIPSDQRLKKLGYRILIIDNYLVFYVIKNQEIEIRRILHGKRKYELFL